MTIKTYIIAAADDFVKIGVSTSPLDRCVAMQIHCPLELKIKIILEGNHERILHTQFTQDRFRGEWFLFSKQIRTFIDSFPYTGEQPHCIKGTVHGNKAMHLSAEHRAAISASWEKKRQSNIKLEDLPKNSAAFRERLKHLQERVQFLEENNTLGKEDFALKAESVIELESTTVKNYFILE